MSLRTVRVPASLLLDRRLSNSAKLLWILWQLGETAPGILQARSGLARETVRYGLARLESAGWLSLAPAQAPSVQVPADLLLEPQLSTQAKLLYACLQLTPGFWGEEGRTTHADLARLTGISVKPVRAAIKELREQDWLEVYQTTPFKPIAFTLRNPIQDRRLGDVVAVEMKLQDLNFSGEAIMHAYLSLIVDCDEFEENARPGFLVNPLTDESMELDRYYPPRVAFEFNGQQHYRTTDRYPNVMKLRKQKMRDLMKEAICARQGITLVVVHAEDLSLAKMQAKVGDLLPRRDLQGREPLIAYLEKVSRPHRKKDRRQT